MASEDSDEVVSGLLPVHGLRNPSDLDQAVTLKVATCRDELDTAGELLEVELFRAPHRMFAEERDDRLQQIRAASHDVALQVLMMVVVPPIHDHLTNTEELTQVVEAREALLSLRHRELVSNLETSLVADSARPAWLPNEAD